MELQAAIIGPGCVGLAIASKLQAAKFATGLIGRGGPVEKKWTLGDQSFASAKRSDTWLGETQLAFVATKAYNLETALKSHLSRLPQNCVVISVCNGYTADIIQRWKEKHSHNLWRLGSVDMGVRDEGARLVMSNPNARIHWGSLWGEKMSPIEAALDSDFFRWTESIDAICKRKWLFNTAANSLAASLNLDSNGLLLEHQAKLEILFEETWRLGETLWGEWPYDKKETWEDFLKLIKATGSNENSMVRDKRLQRKTESDYLAGLAMGRSGFPELQKLHNQLKP